MIAKATHEIHGEVEAREGGDDEAAPGAGAFVLVIVQIIIIDMVFSLDSIITAIGMAQDLEIMIAAVVIACVIMYVSSGRWRGLSRSIRPPRCWRWHFWC